MMVIKNENYGHAAQKTRVAVRLDWLCKFKNIHSVFKVIMDLFN